VSVEEHGVVEENVGSVWRELKGDVVVSGGVVAVVQCVVDGRQRAVRLRAAPVTV